MIVPAAVPPPAVSGAGVSPKHKVETADVTVPTSVMVFSIKVKEATLVQLLAELTITSITSPPLSVNGTSDGSKVFDDDVCRIILFTLNSYVAAIPPDPAVKVTLSPEQKVLLATSADKEATGAASITISIGSD